MLMTAIFSTVHCNVDAIGLPGLSLAGVSLMLIFMQFGLIDDIDVDYYALWCH